MGYTTGMEVKKFNLKTPCVECELDGRILNSDQICGPCEVENSEISNRQNTFELQAAERVAINGVERALEDRATRLNVRKWIARKYSDDSEAQAVEASVAVRVAADAKIWAEIGNALLK